MQKHHVEYSSNHYGFVLKNMRFPGIMSNIMRMVSSTITHLRPHTVLIKVSKSLRCWYYVREKQVYCCLYIINVFDFYSISLPANSNDDLWLANSIKLLEISEMS